MNCKQRYAEIRKVESHFFEKNKIDQPVAQLAMVKKDSDKAIFRNTKYDVILDSVNIKG